MYIVIELQKSGNELSNIVTTFDNLNEADNKYHTILAAAAISNVERHAASMLSDEGYCIKAEYYDHIEGEQTNE